MFGFGALVSTVTYECRRCATSASMCKPSTFLKRSINRSVPPRSRTRAGNSPDAMRSGREQSKQSYNLFGKILDVGRRIVDAPHFISKSTSNPASCGVVANCACHFGCNKSPMVLVSIMSGTCFLL